MNMESNSTNHLYAKGLSMGGHYSKVGDFVTIPLKLQVIKIFAREDIIYYLCCVCDNPKRTVVLRDPFFMICPDHDGDDKLPDMPMDLLEKAAQWVEEHMIDTDDEGEIIDDE